MGILKPNVLHLAKYDGVENTVEIWRWNGTDELKDEFRVTSFHDRIMVEDPTCRESVMLEDVTPEQAVILFATMLGLKEAARE